MEILEIPGEERPIIEPPVEEPATGKAFTETTAAEGVTLKVHQKCGIPYTPYHQGVFG